MNLSEHWIIDLFLKFNKTRIIWNIYFSLVQILCNFVYHAFAILFSLKSRLPLGALKQQIIK